MVIQHTRWKQVSTQKSNSDKLNNITESLFVIRYRSLSLPRLRVLAELLSAVFQSPSFEKKFARILGELLSLAFLSSRYFHGCHAFPQPSHVSGAHIFLLWRWINRPESVPRLTDYIKQIGLIESSNSEIVGTSKLCRGQIDDGDVTADKWTPLTMWNIRANIDDCCCWMYSQ